MGCCRCAPSPARSTVPKAVWRAPMTGRSPFPSPIPGRAETIAAIRSSARWRPVTDGFVRYLRDELQFKTDRPYVLLNGKAARQWNWDSDGSGDSPGAAQALRRALQANPQLRIM